jgi:hypothetical protein
MYLYSRRIRHSDSSSFYEGYTLQGIQESPDSGNTFQSQCQAVLSMFDIVENSELVVQK